MTASEDEHVVSSVAVQHPSTNTNTTTAKRRFHIPLLVGFVPQLTLIVVVCVVSILIFVDLYTASTNDVVSSTIEGSIELLEERTTHEFSIAFDIVERTIDMCRADGCGAYKQFAQNATDHINMNAFRSFWNVAKATVFGGKGKYLSLHQNVRHLLPLPPNATNRFEGEDHRWVNVGCTGVACAGSVAHSDGTCSLGIFDRGWQSRYPSPIDTSLAVIPNYARGNPVFLPRPGTDVRWTVTIGLEPFTKDRVHLYSCIRTFDHDPLTGAPTNQMAITLAIGDVMKQIIQSTKIPFSEFAILDVAESKLIQTTFPSMAPGSKPGVKNESTNVYSVMPELFTFDGIFEPRLIRAMRVVNASVDYKGFDALPTNATYLNLDAGGNDAVSARPIRKVGLNLLLIVVTDMTEYKQRLKEATTEVVIITVVLFVVAAIVGILTAIAIGVPIRRTASFAQAAARLSLHENDDIHANISVFSEIAELQYASMEMGKLLSFVKQYVPQTVLEANNGTSVSMESVSSMPWSASSASNPMSTSNASHRGTTSEASITNVDLQGVTSEDGVDEFGGFVEPLNMIVDVTKVVGTATNTFHTNIATVVFLQRPSAGCGGSTPSALKSTSEQTAAFMNDAIPSIIKSKGVIETQRPDLIVATFTRGVHAERATQCALRITKKLRRQGMAARAIVHTDQFLFGSCGAIGRNAFVTSGDFFQQAPKILELCASTLNSNVVVTNSVVSVLPVSIQAVPIDNLSLPPDPSSPLMLYEVFRIGGVDVPKVKEVFSFMLKGQYKEGATAAQKALVASNSSTPGRNDGSAEVFSLQRFLSICSTMVQEVNTSSYRRHAVSWSLHNLLPMQDTLIANEKQAKETSISASKSMSQVGLQSFGDRSAANTVATVAQPRSDHLGGGESEEDDHDVDAKEEIRKAVEHMHTSVQFTGDDPDSSEALFSMALPDESSSVTPKNQLPAAEGPSVSSVRAGYGLTSDQHRILDNCETNDAHSGTNCPTRFLDVSGQLWIRAPANSSIGSGAFGEVHKAMNTQGDVVAIKCIDLEARELSDITLLETEVSILSDIHHPNLACFISCAVHKSLAILIMEYVAGGTLRHQIQSFGAALPSSAAKRFALDVLKGLKYLHDHNIVHGDIKPENILIGADSVCKITDFGSSVERQLEAQRQKLSTEDNMDIRGTAPYMAPEVARGDLPAPPSDVWSFGILLHEVLTGVLPWSHVGSSAQSQIKLMRGLAATSTAKRQGGGVGKDPPSSSVGVLRPAIVDALLDADPKAADIIRQCFAEDPAQRSTIDELMTSSFFL